MTETNQDNKQQLTGNWVTDTYIGAEKERREREEASRQQSKEFFDRLKQKAEAERAEISNLMNKVAERNYKESKSKRDKDIELAKEQAMKKIEDEYESKHGVRSDKTQQLDDAYHSLTKSLFKD